MSEPQEIKIKSIDLMSEAGCLLLALIMAASMIGSGLTAVANAIRYSADKAAVAPVKAGP